MNNPQKPITLRKMKRMLNGRNYIRLTSYILLAMFPMWVYLNRTSAELTKQAVIWLFISIFFLVLSEIRSGRARRTVRQLRKWEELKPALADLNSEGVYHIPRPSYSSEQTADNVLGEKFIFLFSCGRIIRYYQIKSLSVFCSQDKLQLNISDTTGKTYTLAELPSDRQDGMNECLRQLKARYPGRPLPENTDKEVITV